MGQLIKYKNLQIGKIIFLFSSLMIGGCLAEHKITESKEKSPEVKSYSSESFKAFESGPVRPIAISPDGRRLFSVNTPNNSLEVFNITPAGLKYSYSVPVGLEPVAVAARNNSEIWVVNHLSDSVSVVEADKNYGYVKQTLLMGDEPRDIVFAGHEKKRAFVTVAHRGQSAPFDPQLETPGIGRADVWVFDVQKVTKTFAPIPEHIVNLFSDTPRALTVSPDGRRVYAAAFNSGNQTTVLKAELEKGGLKKPAPHADAVDSPQPLTGLIVKYNGKNWFDDGDKRNDQPPTIWTDRVKFSMPDKDVFVIDADAAIPAVIEEISGVGTTLFNMAVNPKSGAIYVSNTDALNHIRFATDFKYGSNLRGRFIKNQISVLMGGQVTKRELNPHIWLNEPGKINVEADPVDLFPLVNGSFEADAANAKSATGWVMSGDSTAIVTNQRATDNKNSIAITVGKPGAFTYDIQLAQSGKHMLLKDGQRYRMSARVFGSAGAQLDALFQDDGHVEGQKWGFPLGSTGQINLKGDRWEELSFAFTANSLYGQLAFNFGYGGNAGTTFYIDDVRIFPIAKELSEEELQDKSFGTDEEKSNSLAIPLEMVVSQDGKTLYVAAYGSQTVGVFNVKELEEGTFQPNHKNYIQTSGGGPAGLVLNESAKRLYVYTRFDNSVAEIDLNTKQEVKKHSMFNPEPANLVAGRKFLYDARLTSSRGDLSCASCHIFGDTDHLAWDLGDPMGISTRNPNLYIKLGDSNEKRPFFHPMKGPMVTQSLRGLIGNGPMHWRGDRTGALRDSDESIEEQAFEDFNIAFVELHGMKEPLKDEQMQSFTEFALQLVYPPNPIRNLDNSLTPKQQAGANLFKVGSTESTVDCNTCHELDSIKGRFGTNGLTNLSEKAQGRFEDFKIPHLRNMYTKVGMFGNTGEANNKAVQVGDQIRGFGFNHDGTAETLFQVLSEDIFFFPSDEMKRNVVDFTFVINGELNPIVGQQVTLFAGNVQSSEVKQRTRLLISRAQVTNPVPECDLVVKGLVAQRSFSALFKEDKFYLANKRSEAMPTQKVIDLSNEEGNHLTFTCVPPGSGKRIGLGN